MNSNQPLLRLHSVNRDFRRGRHPVKAVRDVSVSIDSGELVVVRGPSGSGKSTLLLMAGGMMRPTSGKVTHHGADIYAMTSSARTQWRRAHVGFVFQQIHLLPFLNVRENIRMAGRSIGASDLEKWLEQLQLTDRATHRPSELSVGEQQRVALIRAIIRKPTLLMADEPISHLDPESSRLVLDALNTYRQQGGAVLMVTHHVDDSLSAKSEFVRQKNMVAGEFLEAEPVT